MEKEASPAVVMMSETIHCTVVPLKLKYLHHSQNIPGVTSDQSGAVSVWSSVQKPARLGGLKTPVLLYK